MVPNWKRPTVKEYIWDIKEGPLTDEDYEMILYFEDLERVQRQIANFTKYLERCYKDSKPGEAKMTYYRIIKELKMFLS